MRKEINIETPELEWYDRKRWLLFGLPWTFTKYSLTKEKLVIEKGLLTTTEDEVRLYRILDIKLKNSLIQKLFNLGTVHICSSDKSLGDFELKNIKDSKKVKELLSGLVEEQRMQKRVVNREIMSFSDDDDEDLEE